MRDRRFRPGLDQLANRIVLSDTSGVVPGTATVTQVVLGAEGTCVTGMMPGEEIDPTQTWNWILAGAPPAPTYDLGNLPLN